MVLGDLSKTQLENVSPIDVPAFYFSGIWMKG